jgi:hypothetical protein
MAKSAAGPPWGRVGFSRLMYVPRAKAAGRADLNQSQGPGPGGQAGGVVRASRLALDPPATQCVNPARFCVIASQLPMHARNIEGDRHFARNDRANKVSTATGIRRGSSDVILQHYTTIPGLYVPTSLPTLHTGIRLLRRRLAASLEAGRPSRHRQPAVFRLVWPALTRSLAVDRWRRLKHLGGFYFHE